MAKTIDYSKNIDATVGRMEGAPRFYVRGDQLYRQDVDDDGYLIPDDEHHIDYAKQGPEQAMKWANERQKKENQFILNKIKSASKNKKR